MHTSPLLEKSPSRTGSSSPDPKAVREQLQRLLAHPLFTNSKRYPVLLTYTVEQTLLGNASQLKERTIGIEAFGRKSGYDANADPVVRTTAAEVRKRLIQYYYDPAHANELAIELTPGSYIPNFREPHPAHLHLDEPELVLDHIPLPEHESREQSQHIKEISLAASVSHSVPGPKKQRWPIVAAAVLLVAGVGFGLGRLHWFAPVSQSDLFWSPLTSASSLTTYCLGEPPRPNDSPATNQGSISTDQRLQAGLDQSGRMNLNDVLTLTRTIAPLAARRDAYRVSLASDVKFTQLREGPLVLIGALDNTWTMRLTKQLRFGFGFVDGLAQITDSKNPAQKSWAIHMDKPTLNLDKDYAIVARYHDSITGQPVFIIAGLSEQGTEAAGEVVYYPERLAYFLEKAPKNWDKLNLEAVIETHVIDGHPGPPNVLAVETW